MKITIPHPGNIYSFMRNIGYVPAEQSYVKRLSSDNYPRFHVYIKKAGSNIVINLHLDQKKPIYKGSPAHAGEYQGKIVEEEAARIKGS